MRPRVVMVGGGFGGLEAAFYLRWRLRDRVDLTLISDQDAFLFKPNTIYIPFGLAPEQLLVPLAPPARLQNIRFVQVRVETVDPWQKVVIAGGERILYDFLVLATGAGMAPQEVPGLNEHAHSIWTPREMLRLRHAINDLVTDAAAGQPRRVLFLVPPNNKCAGPLYEIVFMLDVWLRRHHVRPRVEIAYSTYETGYVQAFGPRLHQVVSAEFDRREIRGHLQHAVERVEPGVVLYRNGTHLSYDLLIAFPPYVAGTRFAGLPADDRGFLRTDPATRQVAGHPAIYAPGDGGDFPVKQAFLAFLQADAAGEHIAAQITGEQPAFAFEPTSMCVMEQFDKATFAQVPLVLTGDPARPVAVRDDADGRYRVGTSPLWRLGKKLLGIYLPWRFAAGQPFHAGMPWRVMEAGLRVMSGTLAS
ncbi:MAG: FAD-dependent oxidoreductase [Armatimonadetes bacterium]|nr:FAD-dependent oxidoreductase [Armatimonadota bacterium]